MKTIFILEDSKTEAYHLKTLLKKNGYDVIGVAETGAEAVSKVPEPKPDLMFADIIIKGATDGIETAIEIKKQINVPVIFLTNYSDEHLVDRALQAAPYAYLIKPVNEDQLRVTLETTANRIRMERERDKLTEQLYQAQKMDAIGKLAGGMAHNYNNIVSIILGNAELLAKDIAPGGPTYEKLNKIVRSGIRARDLTTKLLSLAKKEKADFKTVRLGDILGEVEGILQGAISKKIGIKIVMEDRDALICADAGLVVQAVLNVCLNACDAMGDEGTLTIESGRATLDGATRSDGSTVKPGEYFIIQISDTGPGIPKEILGKVFEPFFTTKDREKGTGLGLYVTESIIGSHNGCVEVESEEGRGATVSIYLPPAEPGARTALRKKNEKNDAAGNELILVVDDEEDFLDMISEMIKQSGYGILQANGGRKAVELYSKRHDDIDLVLLDIMMPEMDGGDVLSEIKKISPDAKVIVCSGYSNNVRLDEMLKSGISAFVQKPFVYSELAETISNVLGT